MSVRQQLYTALVDKHPLLKKKFLLAAGSGTSKPQKCLTLLWLHLQRLTGTLDRQPRPIAHESALSNRTVPGELAEKLNQYDVISFDIFDTLLLRPFSRPVEVFHLVGERLGYLNFADLRERMEWEARQLALEQHGTAEVTLSEIYQHIQLRCGIPAGAGMKAELEVEQSLLYANPYFLEVFAHLEQDKQVIAVSDTYFPLSFLQEVLEQCGYSRIQEVFASCCHRTGKGDGGLFRLVKQKYGGIKTYIHTGDNPLADVESPRRLGMTAVPYANVNLLGGRYRAAGQSAVIGGAWRGLVNARFHAGEEQYSPYYEYGYLAGGIFVLGYCSFIHAYVKEKSIDRILFLARDGDILKQVYDRLYPQEDSRYLYWSRAAAGKLGAGYFKYDYMRRFIHHKTGRQTVEQVLRAMELGALEDKLLQFSGLEPSRRLDHQSALALEQAVERQWQQVIEAYQTQRQGARQYLKEALAGSKRACTVDIGWAGSGGAILSHLVQEWKIPCEVTGVVAGTNSSFCEEPDAAEPLLAAGRMRAYLFSQSVNRDIWSYHNPDKSHNLWLEMLLSAPHPSLLGFALTEEGEYALEFDARPMENQTEIQEIHRGILQFVEDYTTRLRAFPYLWEIAGSDAYAPFRAASASKEYFSELAKNYRFEQGVAEA